MIVVVILTSTKLRKMILLQMNFSNLNFIRLNCVIWCSFENVFCWYLVLNIFVDILVVVLVWWGFTIYYGSNRCMFIHFSHTIKGSLLKRTFNNRIGTNIWLLMCHIKAVWISWCIIFLLNSFFIFINQIRILSILSHYFFKWRLLINFKIIFFMQVKIDFFSDIAVSVPSWFWTNTSPILLRFNFKLTVLVTSRLIILLGLTINYFKWFT